MGDSCREPEEIEPLFHEPLTTARQNNTLLYNYISVFVEVSMRNVTGVPVENDDFFDRARDMERFLQEIGNNSNLLLTTPRRVGKTSLVLQLCRVLKGQNFAVAFFDVEGCSDELAFAEKLVETLRSEGLQPQFLPAMLNTLRKLRSGLGRIKVGAGVNIELDGVSDTDHGTLSRLLESVFQKLEEDGQSAAIAVDELPELLLTISKEEHGAERADTIAALAAILAADLSPRAMDISWLRGPRQLC